MPQNICMVCMDKINDFYEFRLMCLSTDVQTRQALGLPPRPKISEQIIIKKVIQAAKTPVVRLVDINETLGLTKNEEKRGNRRDLKRNLEDPIEYFDDKKKMKIETITAPQQATKKYKINCAICVTQYFEYQSDLTDHLISRHIPNIAKYGCSTCRETFSTQSQAKDHDAMHIKDKIPFVCLKCGLEFPKNLPFTKHLMANKCQGRQQFEVTQEDIKCLQCKKKFVTKNLFSWHGCFLKSKGKCPKCSKYFQKKQQLFKHYVMCEEKETVNTQQTENIRKIKAGMLIEFYTWSMTMVVEINLSYRI